MATFAASTTSRSARRSFARSLAPSTPPFAQGEGDGAEAGVLTCRLSRDRISFLRESQRPRQLATAHARKVDVGEDRIEGVGREQGEAAFGVEYANDLVPAEREVPDEAIERIRMVLYDKYAHGRPDGWPQAERVTSSIGIPPALHGE